MEYRVLGPLEVVDAGGQRVALGGARQRAVLALLLLRADRTVTLERLAEDLWEEPPPTAARTVQAYVSRLRRTLPNGAIDLVVALAFQVRVRARLRVRVPGRSRERGELERDPD